MILECRSANSDWYEDVRRLIDNTLVDIAVMFASRNGKRKRSRGCLSIDRDTFERCLLSKITSLYLEAFNALFIAFERNFDYKNINCTLSYLILSYNVYL